MLPAPNAVVSNTKKGHPVCVLTDLRVLCQEYKGYRLNVVKVINCQCVSVEYHKETTHDSQMTLKCLKYAMLNIAFLLGDKIYFLLLFNQKCTKHCLYIYTLFILSFLSNSQTTLLQLM